MKRILTAIGILWMVQGAAQVGVGTAVADASAALDVVSTTKGFLPPRMTQAQRLAISTPATGLMVFQLDGTSGLYYYSGSAWIFIINGGTAAALPVTNGGTGASTAAGARTALGVAASGANTDITSLAPASTGAVNNMAIGATTPATGAFTTLAATGVFTANAGGSNSFTLPAARGTNGDVLTSNGSGTATWAVPVTEVPAGTVVAFAGSTAPAGWLLCDGSAVNRTGANAALFTAISTTYGSGNGSSTFNLPDLRGRSIFGKDNMGGTAASRITNAQGGIDGATLGAAGGAQSRTLGINELPSHNHGAGSLATTTNGNHNHTFNDAYFAENNGGGNLFGTGANTDWDNAARYINSGTNWNGDHNHTVIGNTANTGSGAAYSQLSPGIVLNYIIKL